MRLVCAAALLLLGPTLWASGQARFRSLIWIAPGEERLALTSQPAICRKPASDPQQVETGEALFNAPMLLGGQAARADISCASCHSNGRRNAHFFLAGVSSAPGTADVSSSFFSVARANGRFDPKPIPDLALPGKISRDAASGTLERFLRGLIVEEFAGREPSQAALSALSAYVRSIAPCEGPDVRPRTLDDQMTLIRMSVRSASRLSRAGEGETAAILIAGARHQLGLIDERYASAGMARERRALLAFSHSLQPAAQAKSPDPAILDVWLLRFDQELRPLLERTVTRSLYNPAKLTDQRVR